MRFLFLFFAAIAVVVGLWTFRWLSPRTSTTEHSPGGFTQQTVGESKAGRAQDMPPEQAADRADTSETGKRAQAITATGSGEMPLSPEQRLRVSEYIKSNSVSRSEDKFGIAIGASVPRQVSLQPLPPELVDIMGKYRGNEYVYVNHSLIVVEPNARRVVAIIPVPPQ